MAGGPTVNLLIAFFIFAGLFATYGNPATEVLQPDASARSRTCVVPAAEDGRVCTARRIRSAPPRRPGSRPATASCPSTARRHDWTDMQDLIRDNGDGAATIVRRARRPPADPAHRHLGHAAAHRRERPDEADSGRASSASRRRCTFTTGGRSTRSDRWAGPATAVGPGLGRPLPVKVWGVAQAIAGVKPRAPDSPVSVVGGGRARRRDGVRADFPLKEKAGQPARRWSRASTSSSACSTSYRCCRSTGATSRAPCGRRSAAASPGYAAGPTRGTSTSPSSSPSRTSSPASCWSWAWC